MLLTALYVYFYSDDSTKEEAAPQKVASGMLDMHFKYNYDLYFCIYNLGK